MPIPIYPSTPVPAFAEIITGQFKTLMSEFDSGEEQRRSLRRFSKRRMKLDYQNLSASEWATVQAFFGARLGSSEAFWWVDWLSRAYTDEYMGRGTGGALTLDLHGVSTSGRTIYKNGVAETAGVDYNISTGTGEAGADQAVWIAGHYPAAGALITHDFTGKLRLKAVFPDELTFVQHSPSYMNIETIELREVQW